MSNVRSHLTRILAIVPHSKGFGYAVFEGVRSPVDWGIKRVTGDKNQATLRKVEGLIEAYGPDAIVLEDAKASRRCERTKKLLRLIAKRAAEEGIDVATYSYKTLKEVFAPAPTTKDALAARIARRFPALRPRLPAPRLPWQSEDYRITIFVACALCLAWFDSRPR